MMFSIALALLVADPTGVNEHEPSAVGQPSQLTLGSIRTTYEMLRKETNPSMAGAWTKLLVQWISDRGQPTDASLLEALLNFIFMWQSPAILPEYLDRFCAVAPGCRRYMADGSGWSERELAHHVNRRHLESETALRKMMAIARLHHLSDSKTDKVYRDALALE